MNPDAMHGVQNNRRFVEDANSILAQNLQKVEASGLCIDFDLIESLLDLQYDVASIYLPIAMQFVNYKHGLIRILVSAFYKNLFAFYGAIDFTKKGLYGPARPILRYLFESVTIAKFCAVSLNQTLIAKWNNGDHIGLSNDVINKIKSPDNLSLKLFLKPLNSFVHHTKSSQQISFDIDENRNEIIFNISVLKVLLECNYHVLNRHIVNNEVIYLVKTYGEVRHNEILKLKKELRERFSTSRKRLLSAHKGVIRDFTKVWLVKP